MVLFKLPWLSSEDRALLDSLTLPDAGHGYDAFGLSRAGVGLGLGLSAFLHRSYFRVEAHGIEHLPRRGAVLLAANHSGPLPIDAFMIWADVVRRTGRVVRPIADSFVPAMPFVWEVLAGAGAICGARANVAHVLQSGQLPLVFPEGVPGVAKPFSERYQLRPFRVGHAELAIRHGVPVVPIGVIGAEEQWPLLARLVRLGRLFRVPYVPVPALPLPLPVHYHLHYGAPIDLRAEIGTDADDPEISGRAAARVRNAVEELVATGLRQRKGIFR